MYLQLYLNSCVCFFNFASFSLSLCQSRILFCLLLLACSLSLILFTLLQFYLYTLFTFFGLINKTQTQLARNSNRNMQLKPQRSRALALFQRHSFNMCSLSVSLFAAQWKKQLWILLGIIYGFQCELIIIRWVMMI